jgi:hypothetical protein
MNDTLSFQSRLAAAAWIGLGGGLLLGLAEALSILSRAPIRSLPGVAAGTGFVIALDGVVGAIGLTLVGLVLGLVPAFPRLRAAPSWNALCVALLGGLLAFLLGLREFGALADGLSRSRIIALAGVSVGVGVVAGLALFWLARIVLAAPHTAVARWARRVMVAVWIVAALLPIVFAIFGRS